MHFSWKIFSFVLNRLFICPHLHNALLLHSLPFQSGHAKLFWLAWQTEKNSQPSWYFKRREKPSLPFHLFAAHKNMSHIHSFKIEVLYTKKCHFSESHSLGVCIKLYSAFWSLQTCPYFFFLAEPTGYFIHIFSDSSLLKNLVFTSICWSYRSLDATVVSIRFKVKIMISGAKACSKLISWIC